MNLRNFRLRAAHCLWFLLIAVALHSAGDAFAAISGEECWDYSAGDEDAAIRFWTESAHSGNAEAQYCLGFLIQPAHIYDHSSDPEEQARKARIAIDWIRRSAEQGYAPAQEHLGMAYTNGVVAIDGVTKDPEQARYWLQKAADQGMAFSHIFLSQMYNVGEAGLPQDMQLAYRHLRISIELLRLQESEAQFETAMGFFGLGEEALRLARQLTAEERAEADTWAKQQLQKFTADANADAQPRPYIVIADYYLVSAQGEAGEGTEYVKTIRVEPGIDVMVGAACQSQFDMNCHVSISVFHPKADVVEFAEGMFLARDAQDHVSILGSKPAGFEHAVGSRIENDAEAGEGAVVEFGKNWPEAFEFVMPPLIVNGAQHDLPIIVFKHVHVREELAPLY